VKITKARLKEIIKEELAKHKPQKLNERKRLSDLVPGDFVEIEISDDGYDKSIEPIEKDEYVNKLRAYVSQKMLAQIVDVAEDYEEEMYESTLKEGMDVDEIDEVERYLKEIADLLHNTYDDLYKAHAPAVFTPQTKADTGEDVTEKTAHRDAKDFILTTLGKHIDGFERRETQNERQLNEDGHGDVPSAVRAMKTIIEDAGQMLDTLEQMGDGSLPTWWTNKMANAQYMMNAMRDYLLYPSGEMEERKLTKPEKKKLKGLEKKVPKKSFTDQYGKDKGEEVYYATLTKQAKEKA